MKKTYLLVLVGTILAGIAALLWWGTATRSVVPTAPAPKATTAPSQTDAASKAEAGESRETTDPELLRALVEKIQKAEAERWSTHRVAVNYQRAANAEERRLALAELRDWRFKREEAAQVLRAALRDTSVRVRVFAADLLYEMGLADGKEILLDVLRSVRSLSPQELLEAVTAAQILDRHHEVVPPDLLIGLYEETKYPGIIGLMAIQGDKQYLPFLLDAARREPNGWAHSLGVSGASEGYALAKKVFENTRNAEAKVFAAWAMFRCSGDREALAYVLDQGSAKVGERLTEGYDPSAVQSAIRLLGVTPDASVLPLLHQALTSNDSITSGIALASLFYIQNDAAFVDQFVRQYLSDPALRTRLSVDPNLVWRIAAWRNDPSLTALAYAANPERTRRLIVEGEDRPVVEVWIRQYLSDIPRR